MRQVVFIADVISRIGIFLLSIGIHHRFSFFKEDLSSFFIDGLSFTISKDIVVDVSDAKDVPNSRKLVTSLVDAGHLLGI